MSDVERLAAFIKQACPATYVSANHGALDVRVLAGELIKLGVVMPHSTDVDESEDSDGMVMAAWFCDCGARGEWVHVGDIGVNESPWAEASMGADDHRMQNGLA